MSVRHVTRQAEAEIRNANRLFFASVDSITESWLRDLNPNAESLATAYEDGRARQDSYDEMVRRVLHWVRRTERVCVALYGHPGVFARVGHEAIRSARAEGYCAMMQPGISAEDCLIADLGVDPGAAGMQSAEATYFLDNRLQIEPRMALVLWQIGLLRQHRYRVHTTGIDIQPLVNYLLEYHRPTHPAIVYEAATHPILPPRIQERTLADLSAARLTWMSTLYIPPAAGRNEGSAPAISHRESA